MTGREVMSWWLVGCWALCGSAAEVTTLTGKKIDGGLTAISADSITQTTATGVVVTPLADVLIANLIPLDSKTTPDPKHTGIELTDGSVVYAASFTLKSEQLVVTLADNRTINIPLTAIASLQREAANPKLRKDWRELVNKRGNRDLLVIQKKVQLTEEEKKQQPGEEEKVVLEGLSGTVGAVDEQGDAISFELTSGRKVSPKLTRVHGLIFLRRLGEVPPMLCRVYDTNFNAWYATKVELKDGRLRLTTVSGVVVEYADLSVLHKLDFSKGKLTYLSDFEAKVEKAPPASGELGLLTGRFIRFQKDRNLALGDLRLGGVVYPKGLALMAGSSLTYQLNDEYKEFKTIIGIDDRMGAEDGVITDSKVQIFIEGDDRELFNATVKRLDKPRALTLGISNIKTLRIRVVADDFFTNHVNLADAKVNK
jgi:hypothetical protein